MKDYDITTTALENAFDIGRQFFDQDASIKEEVHHERYGNVLRGYEKATEVVTVETGGEGVNEAFNWGYERGMDPLQSEEENNLWPSTPREFCSILEEYYTAHLTLCRYLTTLFA